MEDVYVSREASCITWLAKLASSWYHLMSQSLKLGLLQQLQAASAVWKMWLITLRWSLRQVVCISTVASNVRLEFRDIWREIQIIKHHDDRPSQKQTHWLWNYVSMFLFFFLIPNTFFLSGLKHCFSFVVSLAIKPVCFKSNAGKKGPRRTHKI